MKLRYQKCMNSKVFTSPFDNIQSNYIKLDNYIKIIQNAILNKHKDAKNKFIQTISKIDSLSPLKTLARGYSITQKNGNVIKSVNQLKENDKIELRFVDGIAKANIEEVNN